MALKILKHNRSVLEDIAQTLLEDEVLEAKSLAEKLNQVECPPGLSEWLSEGELTDDEPLLQYQLA